MLEPNAHQEHLIRSDKIVMKLDNDVKNQREKEDTWADVDPAVPVVLAWIYKAVT